MLDGSFGDKSKSTLFPNPLAPFVLQEGHIIALPDNIMTLASQSRICAGEHMPLLVRFRPPKGGHFVWPKERNDFGLVVFVPDLNEQVKKNQKGDIMLGKVAWVQPSVNNKGGCASIDFYDIARVHGVEVERFPNGHSVTMFFRHVNHEKCIE